MVARAFQWAWQRYRPAEGWLSLGLLLAAVACLVASVVAVEWTPEADIVTVAAPLGLLMATALAKRPLRPLPAWLLLLGYGVTLTTFYLGRLLPPVTTLISGDGGAHFRRQWAVLVDRSAGWVLAVIGGGRSQETIVFTFGIGLLAWILGAYAGWVTYRQHRPLVAITPLGVALAANGYFSGDENLVWLAAFFVGCATLLAAAMHYANMEVVWGERGVDYSREIRLELLAAAGGIALALLSISFVLPTMRFRALTRAFQEMEAVQQVEGALERAFGGVRQPRGGTAFGPGGAGVLPRSFLLGDAPELYETLMMTATVRPQHPSATHWRAVSYDVYTGRGWAISEEREEPVAAGERLALPTQQGQSTFTQTVQWLYDERTIRYTIGLPLRFDEPVTARWRGVEDLSRVNGEDASYTAVSRLTTAGAADLGQARTGDVPTVTASRYTNLPDGVPARVLDLARDITGPHETPFAQARALEGFLRQYAYSLEIDAPPAGRDPVDYFLFELQRGYCDYYASAMVVMARSVGLPARLATGYLAQAPDDAGVQSIYQINAHAWPELYFAGYGWVEFEPTAAFSSTLSIDSTPAANEGEVGPEEESPVVVPPPPPAAPAGDRLSPIWAILPLILILGLWIWWHLRPARRPSADAVLWAYSHLLRAARRLGHPTPASQTPAEFQSSFLEQVSQWEKHPRLAPLLSGVRPSVERLTALFIARQYGPQHSAAARAEAVRLWRHMARRLWLLRLTRLFVRK